MPLQEGYATEDAFSKKRKRSREGAETIERDLYADTDLDAPEASGSASAATRAAAQSIGSGESAADIAGNTAIMSGNPWAMTAGVGLKVLDSSRKKEDAYNQMKAKAENQRIANQQAAMSRLISVSQGLSRL